MTADPFIPLSTAAARTYRALVGGDATDGLLDVVAVALSACVPIYGARVEPAPRRLPRVVPA